MAFVRSDEAEAGCAQDEHGQNEEGGGFNFEERSRSLLRLQHQRLQHVSHSRMRSTFRTRWRHCMLGHLPCSYLVGTEEGQIHRCSCSYNEQYLDSYHGHTGPVNRISWSPFCSEVFLSCSGDWTMRLWHQDKTAPVLNFYSSQVAFDSFNVYRTWLYVPSLRSALTISDSLSVSRIFRKPCQTCVGLRAARPSLLASTKEVLKCGISLRMCTLKIL